MGGFMKTADELGDLNEHPDARLIAAAPELLEACKRISDACFGVALGDLDFLRAAIAKAEGNATPNPEKP